MADDPLDDEQAALDAEDGKGDAASIEARAANGDHLQDTGPAPVGGDVQLSMDVGKVLTKASRKVLEATLSVSSAEKPVDGLFKPDQRYPFLLMGVPGNVDTVYVRDPKSTSVPKAVKGVKLRQHIAVDTIRRADDPDVIAELFSTLLEQDAASAGNVLEALQAMAASRLRAAA